MTSAPIASLLKYLQACVALSISLLIFTFFVSAFSWLWTSRRALFPLEFGFLSVFRLLPAKYVVHMNKSTLFDLHNSESVSILSHCLFIELPSQIEFKGSSHVCGGSFENRHRRIESCERHLLINSFGERVRDDDDGHSDHGSTASTASLSY